jgi:hypothetical protein
VFATHVPELGLRVEASVRQLYVRFPVKPESQAKELVPESKIRAYLVSVWRPLIYLPALI